MKRTIAVLAATMLTVGSAFVSPTAARAAAPIPMGLVSAAFQADTGILWTVSPSGVATSTGLAMRTSSSPSVRTIHHGMSIAFQANTGVLWTWSNGVARSTGLPMKHGTSPRGTAEPGDAIAFQGHDGYLWTYRNGTGQSSGLRMKAATSPDILPDPSGGFWIAFQADTSELWIVSPSGAAWSTGRRMRAGTSPALTPDDTDGIYDVAFQADTGELWIVNTAGIGLATGLRMMPGTSPTITEYDFWHWSGHHVALQLDNGELWSGWISDLPGLLVRSSFGHRMRAGTSPAQTLASPAGLKGVAYQSDTGALWIVNLAGEGYSAGVGMLAGTSPGISGSLLY